MKMLSSFGCLLLLLFLAASPSVAQTEDGPNKKYLQKLIRQDSLEKAENLVQQYVQVHLDKANYDSLIHYIDVVGNFKLNAQNQSKALKRAEDLVHKLLMVEDPFVSRHAYSELAWLQNEYSLFQDAYQSLEKAKEYAQRLEDYSEAELDRIEYSMGNNAYNLGKYELAKKHYQKSLKYLLENRPDHYESIQATYNSLGTTAWMEAKMDSCAYFFEQALKTLSKTDNSDLKNHYYRPALINSNLSIVMNAQGKSTEAIKYTEEAIANYGAYIQKVEDEGLALQALKNQLATISNLGSYYGSIGKYAKALDLIEYAYRKRLEIYEEGDMDIIVSLAVLSQTQISNLLFEKAEKNTAKAIGFMDKRSDINPFWKASIYYTRGAALENLKRREEAADAYQVSETIMRQTLNGNYNKEFMDQLMIMSLFYANNGFREKAENLADEIYEFGKTSDFKNSLQHFHYIVNRAEVSQQLKDYDQALAYSEEALELIREIKKAGSTADSILFDYRRPKAILINVKAKYQLQAKGNKKALEAIDSQLQEAFTVLKQRKGLFNDHQAVALQMHENENLYDFAKRIQLELYELTDNQKYLDNLINLHESALYSRIRTQLNLRDELGFLEIPEKVLKRESQLQKKLASSLEPQVENLQDYFEINKQWEKYTDSLRQFYPKYYQLKYGSIQTEIPEIVERLPEGTSLVRYFFVEEDLYALLVSENQKKLYSLKAGGLKEDIATVNSHSIQMEDFNKSIVSLYEKLWQPFAGDIQTERVIIVPDENLYNLSFELLNPVPYIPEENKVETNLLYNYVLSYNYSLHGIGKSQRHFSYAGDFIAFAPGFGQKMKQDYRLIIQDSSQTDRTYLTLLPQPFSESVSKRFSKVFGGDHYLNENATKKTFTQSAGNHKIIHIATHAESNNLNPELSRLVFAKHLDSKISEEDNYLYTYEIYNTNLNSQLAVLTACETGKPTHKPGEGMISLAHAFSYAGSESILTSLWKIDEEASTHIIDGFYKNLADGMTKDLALKNAKLAYLETAKGRSLSPQYWAGMVLMGDASPLDLAIKDIPSSVIWWEILGILTLLVLAVLVYGKIKKSKI